MALLIILFFCLMLLGAPIAIAMVLSSAVVFGLQTEMPIQIVAQRMQYGVDSFSQLAIPFFILAGQFMNHGGISNRIIKFASTLVGHIKGGLAQVMILASMLFAGISGSAYADASMLGTVLLPRMKEKKYPVATSTVILAAGATIGPIIPPSIQMVIYGVTASVSVGQLLIAGFFPGIVMGVMLMLITGIIAKKEKWPKDPKATWKERGKAFLDALWALLMPILIVGGMLTGIFTPTEAAVIASLYAFLVGKFVYKELKLKDVLPICRQVFKQTAQVTIIIAAAGVLGWLMTKERIPTILSEALLSVTDNKVIILLLVNLILLVLGCFMETTAIVLLMTPVLLPLMTTLGISPVHFGVFMILNLCIGLITPPVGMCMYIGCGISGCSIGEFSKKLWPFFAALVIALLITVFCEPVSMFLPKLLF